MTAMRKRQVKRIVWKLTKGTAKVALACVLAVLFVAVVLPFLLAGLFGHAWQGPR